MQSDPAPHTSQRPSDTTARTALRRVVPLVFAVLLLDGYDTTALGFAIPALAREWDLAPVAFTPALVATNCGVVIGYVLCGRLAARFGRRAVISAGTLAFAAGSALTVAAQDPAQLAAIRAATAVGLGVVLPTCISLAADHAPAARRGAYTVGVTLALSVGATAGGLIGGKLIAAYGWTSVFWVGALLPAALVPALIRWLPAERTGPRRATSDERPPVGLTQLFTAGAATSTLLLWSFAFLVFTATFALQAWLPTVLATAYGAAPEDAPLASAALGFGGVVGGLALVPAAARFGIPRALVVAIPAAGATLVVAGGMGTADIWLFMVIAVTGAGVSVGLIGQAALAAQTYRPEVRTTGIAGAAAMGRVGSVVGPAVAGALLGAGVAGQELVLVVAVPVFGAALIALVIAWRRNGLGTEASADRHGG
ncbi:MFS transporter [Nocardiopsis sp. NPDC049922]|uniref:MFS transporter n=1 Tax=Nocardiopsis sp. NPDC049922 TaxID=3155157 RepID=UPI0033EA2A9E